MRQLAIGFFVVAVGNFYCCYLSSGRIKGVVGQAAAEVTIVVLSSTTVLCFDDNYDFARLMKGIFTQDRQEEEGWGIKKREKRCIC